VKNVLLVRRDPMHVLLRMNVGRRALKHTSRTSPLLLTDIFSILLGSLYRRKYL